MRHLNNGTDHRHSKSCCDQSSPARRTIKPSPLIVTFALAAGYYSNVIMSTMASQMTSLTIVDPTHYSGADQRTHQSSASLTFVRGSHRWPVNSLHRWPVTRKMFPFDDVSMIAPTRLPKQNRNRQSHYRNSWEVCASFVEIDIYQSSN